jgi:hypothetical protein
MKDHVLEMLKAQGVLRDEWPRVWLVANFFGIENIPSEIDAENTRRSPRRNP